MFRLPRPVVAAVLVLLSAVAAASGEPVTVDAAAFQPALVAAGGTIFKELAQVLSAKR